jgi:hypothetical protein
MTVVSMMTPVKVVVSVVAVVVFVEDLVVVTLRVDVTVFVLGTTTLRHAEVIWERE